MYMIAKQMTSSKQHHETNSKWIFWAHMPHDTNWNLESYKKIDNVKIRHGNWLEEKKNLLRKNSQNRKGDSSQE